jgi:uncharacterized small protein (DUF1192 family)
VHPCDNRAGRRYFAVMAIDDDPLLPKKKPVHELGQDLALLSVEELGERIAALRDEVVRLETAVAAKKASRSAADQFFKR